jgi:3-deoxy-D-manno-octulosonic-acid transferase
MRLLVWWMDWIERCPWFLRIFGVRESRIAGFVDQSRFDSAIMASNDGNPSETVWFHASSLGELEMIRPLIEDFLAVQKKVAVSVFSDSALSGLRELAPRCVFAGLSPSEGLWSPVFERFGVRKLVLSKYDFWPGMLDAASRAEIPILVINAEARGSLLRMKRIFRWFRRPLPRFWFFSNSEPSRALLRAHFPGQRILPGTDPRWERVCRRREQSGRSVSPNQERILFWTARMNALPAPRIILGSAWMTDLEQVLPAFEGSSASLVVVPHSLDSANLTAMRDRLGRSLPGRFVLVSEMGLLVELYSHADRAIVGGGFGKSIHSTLEPAISGIPVACGPAGVERFPDAIELSGLGVLRICRSAGEFRSWIDSSGIPSLSPAETARRRRDYLSLLEESLRIR